MAGKAASPSRMGLTLQGLDQVIALSQANINESLKHHFKANPALCNFKVVLQTEARETLKGTLKPPTIELIDIENGDQALYCLDFEDGEYSWMSIIYGDEDEDPKTERKRFSAKGWRLAFYVDFAMKKLAVVDPKIAAQIQLPGSYSINQLLVNFGTADTMTFNWAKSKITGLGAPGAEQTVQDTMGIVIKKWLTGLKANGDSHNVLGSAVKVEPPPGTTLNGVLSKLPAPDFPPTAVHLQTINHRPGGDPAKSSTDNGHNAFLFTEMTGGRELPNQDLKYSGDWFYDSIGGTLVMSRSIFWNKFLAVRLRKANVRAIESTNELAELMSLQLIPQKWIISDAGGAGEGDWTSTWNLENTFEWTSKKRYAFEKEVPGPNLAFVFDVEATIKHSIRPIVGTGNITLLTSLIMKSNLGGNMAFLPGNAIDIASTVNASTVSNIQLQTELGRLKVNVTRETPKVTVNSTGTSLLSKFPVIGAELEKFGKDMADTDKFIATVKGCVEKGTGVAVDIKSTVETALNGQSTFVFPGNGVFNMKDPIFNNAGDLMVGLMYIKEDRDGGQPIS